MKKNMILLLFVLVLSLSLVSAIPQSYIEEYMTICEDDDDCFFNGNGRDDKFDCYNPTGLEYGYCLMTCEFDSECTGFPVDDSDFSCEALSSASYCMSDVGDSPDYRTICQEYDGGRNYGVASYAGGFQTVTPDSCNLVDSDLLNERYCSGFDVLEETVSCSDLGEDFYCDSGACIDPSGRPINYEQSCHHVSGSPCPDGMVCVDDDTYSDECLLECSIDTDCPQGKSCSDGLCITETFRCSDGLDNDEDGLIDLDDPGCKDESDNAEKESYSTYRNSCDSPAGSHVGCGTSTVCTYYGEVSECLAECGSNSECTNTFGDGYTCRSGSCLIARCNDGIDNSDGDGLIDLDDPDCFGINDDSETTPLEEEELFVEIDGVLTDLEYESPGNIGVACKTHSSCGEGTYCFEGSCAVTKCNNGRDDDGDGTIDFQSSNPDTNCLGNSDNTESDVYEQDGEAQRAARYGAPEFSKMDPLLLASGISGILALLTLFVGLLYYVVKR
jgi:hypothetical protein